MNHFETIKNHLNAKKTQDVLFADYVTDLIGKNPYASFLYYFSLSELKAEDNFEEIQRKTLTGKNHKGYIKYLLALQSNQNYKEVKPKLALPETEQWVELPQVTHKPEPIKEEINPLQQTDKNEIPNLLSTLLNLYDSDEEKQKIINELIKKEEEKKDIISLPPVPIEFDLNKKMSFQQWVKITDGIQNTAKQNQNKIVEIKKQEQIIDQFLEQNPKITPAVAPKIEEKEYQNKPLEYFTIMTETLAQIYIDQQKYDKAIEAYKTLSLKYPEKNVYFAEQLERIEQLKNNS